MSTTNKERDTHTHREKLLKHTQRADSVNSTDGVDDSGSEKKPTSNALNVDDIVRAIDQNNANQAGENL